MTDTSSQFPLLYTKENPKQYLDALWREFLQLQQSPEKNLISILLICYSFLFCVDNFPELMSTKRYEIPSVVGFVKTFLVNAERILLPKETFLRVAKNIRKEYLQTEKTNLFIFFYAEPVNIDIDLLEEEILLLRNFQNFF